MCSARRVATSLVPVRPLRRFRLVCLFMHPPLLACAPRTTTTPELEEVGAAPAIIVADGGSEGPAEPPREGAPVKAEAPPANARLTMNTPFVFAGEGDVEDGGYGEVELTLTSVVSEMIEASPVDPESYPAGSGVTVSIDLSSDDHQHVAIDFARLSAGYTSKEVVWTGPLRIELRAVEDAAVEVFASRMGAVLQDPPPRRVTILKDEDVALSEDVAVRLLGHGHKRTFAEGPASPLLVALLYTMANGDRDEVHFSIPPGGEGWSWRDLDFRTVKVSYGESMEVDVGRRALTPLRPRGG